MSWETKVAKFMKYANAYCLKRVGVHAEDLPDLFFVSDYMDEDMSDEELKEAAVEYVDALLEEEGIDL